MYWYATDYDGTLNCRGITPELRETIALWRTAGNRFGVVSGRPYDSIRRQMDHDGLEIDFLIANNGSIIADGKDRMLEVTSFPIETAERLIERLRGESPGYFRMDAVRFYREWKAVPEIIRKNGLLSVGEEVWPEITEITVVYPNEEVTQTAAKAVEETFGGGIRPLLPGLTTIDYVPGTVNKAAAVKRVTELFGDKPEKILTTGDSFNDLAMLIDPDFEGYAVENAITPLKEAVGRTIPDPLTLMRRYL